MENKKIDKKMELVVQLSFVFAAALALLTDQLTKMWVSTNMTLGQSIPPDGPVRLTYVRNTGVAFGLFPGQTYVITIAAIAGLIILLVYYRLSPFRNIYTYLGLGFILGGSVGNLMDRIRLGYVIDFVDFRVWPVFNVSDSAVVLGTGIMLYYFIFKYKSKT